MSDVREEIVELAGGDDELMFCGGPPDDFDDCIIGIAERFQDTVVCYDKEKVLASLAKEFARETRDYDSDPETDALEWFHFNTLGSWIGEKTPVFVTFLDRKKNDQIDHMPVRETSRSVR